MADMIQNGVHGCTREERYITPENPRIRQRLEWFKDQKLALMMHFGPYSQMGVDCSWPLSEKDSWARTRVDWEEDLDTFRRQYVNLNKSFNPLRVQPEVWADFAKDNGFRYLIFTTKHHDGFCMFDTKLTDYKITSPDCPFHTHKYANLTKEVFDAFRQKGLGIAAYFSKPDWNCPWYWAEGMDRPWGTNRHATYTPAEHPELWEKFIQFTHGQMMELVKDYGKLDVLWLDGGQVRDKEGQGIRLSEFVQKAREITPDLIVADRCSGTENENYITPEQSIPDHVISVPWESCITLGSTWMYTYDDSYKSARSLVKMLLQVVSRGGNLAINIGPQPDGRLPEAGLRELRGLGDWLKINGEAIYATRPAPYEQSETLMYTQKGDTLYALIPLEEGARLPQSLLLPIQKQAKALRILGRECSPAFEQSSEGLRVFLPEALQSTDSFALALAIE